MQNDVITKFDKGLNQIITKQQIRQKCPVAFKQAPTNPEVSNKYLFVNTETIIDDLSKLGWYPVTAAQRKSKGKDTIYSKHMISFQNPDIIIRGVNGDDAYPRIILTNSHDGLQSFQFSVGIFRLACSNGLIIATDKFSEFKIKHKGYTFQELRNIVSETVKDLPNKVEVLNKMRARTLTTKEKQDLALNAMLIRAGIDIKSDKAKQFKYDQVTLDEILEPNRPQDQGDDLWRTFNVVQEKIVKGDFHAALTGAKVRKVRPIKSFVTDLKVNKELFKLATSLL